MKEIELEIKMPDNKQDEIIVRDKLVYNYKDWYKFLSIRLTTFGSTLLLLWFSFSNEIILWWNTNALEYFPFVNPVVIKWIGLILVISSAFARVYKQKNVR